MDKKGIFFSENIILLQFIKIDSDVFTPERGFSVYIHNYTETYPFNYINIEPGKHSNIAIKRTVYQRLSAPYTSCIDDLSSGTKRTEIMNYMFDTLKINSYTYKLCESIVFTKLLKNACNCMDKTYIFAEFPQLCYTSAQINCMNSFRSTYSSNPSAYLSDNCPTGLKNIALLFI
jgi:hypothetical protein